MTTPPPPRTRITFVLSAALLCLALAGPAWADEDGGGKKKRRDRDPANVDLNDPPEVAAQKLSVTPGLKVDLWAAEPLLENPVAFSIDERGRAFVVETGRRRTSTLDIRKNMEWLLPDLALQTVEERAAFLRASLPPETPRKPDPEHNDVNGDGQFDWRDLAIEGERIRLVEDSNGDGVADNASVFAEGFNALETGVAAGILARGNEVWFACIPNLWRLQGANGPVATQKTPVLSGFGVHVAYGGHDMHGVKMGPDGKIYWTIADCGAHVVTKEGTTISMPDQGSVFRANPDGSEMELVAHGLRNPQCLAFNEVGDLFTGDNNADGGDKARWEHIVEGGDYGWRIGWQFQPKLGAWNSELLWELNVGETCASILPPVAHIGHGPAGIAYYPGSGLPPEYRDHFFYADFPGGIRTFAMQRKGSSYTVENPGEVLLDNSPQNMTGKFLWGMYPTDVQFGVEGGLYVLDWVQGWDKTGKGRIFRVHAPEIDAGKLVQETRRRLAENFANSSQEALLHGLDDPDMRVRLAAQFALAEQGAVAIPALARLAGSAVTKNENDRLSAQPVSRLHAIWALAQIGRQRQPIAFAELAALLGDRESEVRAQAAKVLGVSGQPANGARLIPLLQDTEPRVRFFAAQSLGQLRSAEAVNPLAAVLRDHSAGDPFLRHAASLALSRCADVPALTSLARDPSLEVRLGVLLALRHLARPEVSLFLHDREPRLVLEAARAVHDEPILTAYHELATLPTPPEPPEALSRRMINAAYVTGTAECAQSLANAAADKARPEAQRLDALEALGDWNTSLGQDRVLGLARTLPKAREAGAAAGVFKAIFPSLLKGATAPLSASAINGAAKLKLKEVEPDLLAACLDAAAPATTRLAALKALAALQSPQLKEAVASALASRETVLVLEARRLAAASSPGQVVEEAKKILASGSLEEKQASLELLGLSSEPDADALLIEWLDRLAHKQVPINLQLELLEAARQHPAKAVQKKLASYEAKLPADDLVAKWSICLEGGNTQAGRQVFTEKAEAGCIRCHKVNGEGGDVGPDLGGIGARHDRAYLLASIVTPNAAIAPGFESVLLTMKDGSANVGIVRAEDAAQVTLIPLAGGPPQTLAKDQIAQRQTVPSPMPPGLAEVLGARDLRNVIEYLASLR